MKVYTNDLADRLKARAGQPWRPGNGTEGEIFQEEYCGRCKFGGPAETDPVCRIYEASFWNFIGDPDYPEELTYGNNGQPKCAAFAARQEGER